MDNPEDTYQFTNRIVRQFLAENVSAYEVKQARGAAEAALDTTITISDPS